MKHWLFKSEPSDFSLQDLKDAPDQTECWDGVRNYQARNLMRDEMKLGDRVLFYHSNLNPSVVGTVTVVRESYPDHTSWDPDCKHFDPKSTPDNPRWFMVDVKFESEFPRPLPLAELRTLSGLEEMLLLRKGQRLSVKPVAPKEFQVILDHAAQG